MSEYTMTGTKWRSAYNRDGTTCGRSTPATLDSYGETLLTTAKSRIAAYDHDGTKLKIAVITDLHRSEDGTYTTNTIDDRYSLRLLSRLCDEIHFDAVFCGGDITNARDENAQYFRDNMEDVVADFDDLLPYTNVFATIGNHDKRYSTSRPNNTNEWLYSLYVNLYQDGNGVELHYIDETNFYVDFTKHHVRFIFINQYDDVDSNASWYANENLTSSTGIHTRGTTAWKAALPTTDKASWWVGIVYHGADNTVPSNPSVRDWSFTDLSDTISNYISGGGKVLGAIAGHYHTKQVATIQPGLNVIHVANAYATTAQLESVNEYCFSVFVIDTDTGMFHEVRTGRNAKRVPYHAMPGANNGLLQNGTASPNNSYDYFFCVYDGNKVRFDERWNVTCNGWNFTNLWYNWGYYANDFVTSDTSNVLFSAQAGDVITTEIIFTSDTGSSNQNFKVFSPQISTMVSGKVVAGATYTNDVTLSADTDVTSLGMYYRGQSSDGFGVMEFEINVYKNGVRLVRT